MNDLTIQNREGKLVVSSKVIAKELGKRHADVIKQIESILSQNENLRFDIIKSSYQAGTGKNYKEYLLTKDGFTLYMFNIQGYNDFKLAYINEFNRMEQALKKQKPQLPTTYLEALEQLVASEKEKLALQERQEKLIHSTKTYTTTELAKELGYKSAMALNKELHKRGIQYKQSGTWVLYSKYSDKGYVSIKQTILDDGRVIYNTKWTSKGRDWLINEVLC